MKRSANGRMLILWSAFVGALVPVEAGAVTMIHRFTGSVTAVVLPQPNAHGLSSTDVGRPVHGEFVYETDQMVGPPLGALTVDFAGVPFAHDQGAFILNQTDGFPRNNRALAGFAGDVDYIDIIFSGMPTLTPMFSLGATSYLVRFVDTDASVFDASDESNAFLYEDILQFDLSEFEAIRWSYDNSDDFGTGPGSITAAGELITVIIPEPSVPVLGLLAILMGVALRRRR